MPVPAAANRHSRQEYAGMECGGAVNKLLRSALVFLPERRFMQLQLAGEKV